MVVTRNQLFSKTMARHGHNYKFKSVDIDRASGPTDEADTSEDEDDLDLVLRKEKDQEELEEIMYRTWSIQKTAMADFMRWLREIYQNSRGFELGTFDSSLLALTMKTQSSKWEAIVLSYICDVVSMAYTFITTLLRLVCPNLRICDGLVSVLTDKLVARYKAALESGHFLLRIERKGTPITLNELFSQRLEER